MKNIILIGFMGSGKTTIGKIISDKKNMRFIDMDLEIEKMENKKINQIFSENGEKYFREKESSLLKQLCSLKNSVISTGGGIIENEFNIEILKKQPYVIWLDANEDTIENNVKNEIEKRPKLKEDDNLKLSIKNLLNKRYDKYKESANIRVNVNNKNVDQVVSDILVYI
ncbi:Shikimate kinase [uncultured Clostridium sp.]|uniref:shikimate kinase n=1 Tax=Paeniclostridium hominis TaxID=2764329 RepID=UPI00082177B8|nr:MULTISPECIES: shikimate kinase [Paeniclostridium]MBC8631111.1 shikimate kinase [[Eubacterium] tenue]SCI75150.1 Shikimate kinase [uncultured Clostridium sp.]SCJ10898.1 Shikimate kinase [uncultured Clostridium sp.]